MSNNTEFKWTVDLLAEFIRDYVDKDGTAAELMEQFKESKQPKPEWKILSLKHGNTLYTWTDRNKTFCYEGPGQDVSLDWALESGFEINSVKRLSDGMEFSVNDFIEFDDFGPKGAAKIDKFEIDPADNDIVAYNGCYGLGFSHWKKAIPILFTTEDGIAIYKNYSGRISAVYEDFSFNYDCTIEFILSERETPHTFTIKYFSTKEAATNFILDNKPLLSLKEIREVGHAEKHNHYYKKLVALAESKLK